MPAPTTRPRQIVKQAQFAADGTASIRFDGPGEAFWTLVIAAISLDGTNSDLLPTARLYAGDAGVGRLVAMTLNGKTAQFVGSGDFDRIDAGSAWTLALSGGTPGRTITATLTGTEQRR